MNILITGATGYIGRRLKHRLLSEEVTLRLFMKRDKPSIEKQNVQVAIGTSFDPIS